MWKRIIVTVLALAALSLSAGDYGVTNNHANLANDLRMGQSSTEEGDGSESTGTVSARKKKAARMKEYRDGKSPLLASGLSLLVPGAGEIYGEDYLMGGIFLGIEAGLWGGYYYYETKGDDKTSDYKKFADDNFSANRYYRAVNQLIWSVDTDTLGLKPTYEQLLTMSSNSDDAVWKGAIAYLSRYLETEESRLEFTHQLPARFNGETGRYELDKTQQYYEMIGKYHQFASGWNDYNGWQSGTAADGGDSLITGKEYQNDDKWDSDKRKNIYENMRDEANQAYEMGTNFLMITLLNRIVSAFDASYVIKRDFTVDTALRFENNPHQPGPISANNYKMTLNISW